MGNTIYFCRTTGPYGGFSNFSPHQVKLDGQVWPTSEHYFQAQKFEDGAIQKRIRSANSPMLAARIGRSRSLPLRKDWESVKVEVMRKVVLAKFQQHHHLQQTLLDTGEAKLVEHTARDAFWGDGPRGRGKNWLGRILMEVRETLRNSDGAARKD